MRKKKNEMREFNFEKRQRVNGDRRIDRKMKRKENLMKATHGARTTEILKEKTHTQLPRKIARLRH